MKHWRSLAAGLLLSASLLTLVLPMRAYAEPLSGGLQGGSTVVRNQDGTLEVFVLGPVSGGGVAYDTQATPGGGWSGWAWLGNPTNTLLQGFPAVGQNTDGTLAVFATGMDGNLYSIQESHLVFGSFWGNWVSLGRPQGTTRVTIMPSSVASNRDGRLDVFATGSAPAYSLYHISQITPGGNWSGWASLGNPVGLPIFGAPGATSLAVGQNADGRLEVFVVGDEGFRWQLFYNSLWHISQTTPGGAWSGWASLGEPGIGLQDTTPAVGVNQDGRLEAFAIGFDGGLYAVSQTVPGGSWSGWASLGSPSGVGLYQPGYTPLAVARYATGALVAFVVGNDGFIYTSRQIAPGGGSWYSWQELSGASPADFRQPYTMAAGQNADGRLQLFATGANSSHVNNLWDDWQGSICFRYPCWNGWFAVSP